MNDEFTSYAIDVLSEKQRKKDRPGKFLFEEK